MTTGTEAPVAPEAASSAAEAGVRALRFECLVGGTVNAIIASHHVQKISIAPLGATQRNATPVRHVSSRERSIGGWRMATEGGMRRVLTGRSMNWDAWKDDGRMDGAADQPDAELDGYIDGVVIAVDGRMDG